MVRSTYYSMKLTLSQKQALHPFNIIIFVLSLYVVVALVIDVLVPLPYETSRLLHDIDRVICIFFFIDFLVRFFTAKSKWHYMRWGWIDLLSSIPVFEVFQAARMFRIIQLLRVLRAFRSMRILLDYYFHNRVKGAFTSVSIIAILTIIFSAISILGAEKDAPNANIKTAEDALWWAYTTITTVGYGDKYPVTTAGRLIATALMTVGVGLFGTFTAYTASWFVGKREEEEEHQKEQHEAAKKKPLEEVKLIEKPAPVPEEH